MSIHGFRIAMLRVPRRMAAASLLLLAACHADLPPIESASSSGASGLGSVPTATASIPEPACAVEGGIARITIQSEQLSSPVRVSIVDPTADASVLYLLHGAQTDESQWEAIGIKAALDDLTATGHARAFTVALPDLPTGGDPALDGVAFFDEVVPAVERCLGGPRSAAHRAVGGISRGGSLALEMAAEHGDAFAAVGGHSPAVADVDQTSLAQRLASSHVPVWLDVGTEDALVTSTKELATALTDAGSSPELHLAAGAHDRAYWGAHVNDYLQWYASAITS